MLGWTYGGPFDQLPAVAGTAHRVIPWKDVGADEGTGIVHIAPGAGEDDFRLSQELDLPVLVPIDENGVYVDGYDWLSGRDARQVADDVIADLRARGLLYRAHRFQHRYPHCWRCQEELVFRVDDEWFIRADEVRQPMLDAAATVHWVPEYAGARMADWLRNMGDWNISRRRYWGLPLPFYPCQACGHLTVIGSKAHLEERAISGLDQLRELHRPWIDRVVIRCEACEAPVHRIDAVGDAWLDAGIVPFSTLGYLEQQRRVPALVSRRLHHRDARANPAVVLLHALHERHARGPRALSRRLRLRKAERRNRPRHAQELGQRHRLWRGSRAHGRGCHALALCRAEPALQHQLRLRTGGRGQAAHAHAVERLCVLRHLRPARRVRSVAAAGAAIRTRGPGPLGAVAGCSRWSTP